MRFEHWICFIKHGFHNLNYLKYCYLYQKGIFLFVVICRFSKSKEVSKLFSKAIRSWINCFVIFINTINNFRDISRRHSPYEEKRPGISKSPGRIGLKETERKDDIGQVFFFFFNLEPLAACVVTVSSRFINFYHSRHKPKNVTRRHKEEGDQSDPYPLLSLHFIRLTWNFVCNQT